MELKLYRELQWPRPLTQWKRTIGYLTATHFKLFDPQLTNQGLGSK